ncbi:hypothetical protein PRUPE_4G205800 [Prunus persica]|uniref:Uncharacterized protein n=1 Tax=Prunus persica TaxID=3760 RepID=A0A251PNJ7_PRUPE|nr:uncharacterized protein LOC18778287 isoform X2 [Prunus persica]ONI13148.1 hypothetical protein PRUPE_4G205800 [Prunus persica]
MEDHHSMNSMMRKSVSSENTRATSHESPEESSWTMYLEDFLTSNNDDGDDDERSSSSHGYENSSTISDAASAVTRKLSAINGEVLGFDNRSSFEFERRKTKEDLLDDALEDTASSPVNSPKEKGSTSGLVVDERNELGFIGRESDCTDLKKRGLCLVPFSVVANYFG